MSTDPTAVLLHTLVDNMRSGFDDPVDDWDALAMVIELGDGYFSAHGYAYPADGSVTAVSATPGPIRAAVDDYLAGKYQPGDAPPVALLVQLERATGRYEVTFEDSDETRWKVTPKNFGQVREDLRPRFD